MFAHPSFPGQKTAFVLFPVSPKAGFLVNCIATGAYYKVNDAKTKIQKAESPQESSHDCMSVSTNLMGMMINKPNSSGYLKFPKRVNLTLKTRLQDIQLNQVRLIPQGIGYRCELVYTKEIQPQHPLDHTRVASIDLGVRNLVTLVTNIGTHPIVVKGGVVKSINQYYNKRRATYQRIYRKKKVTHTSKRLWRLSIRRNRKLADYFHKLSHKVVTWCITQNIGTLVIGYNENWKQQVHLGTRTNQTFVNIPFYWFLYQLCYKAEEQGLRVIKQEESYTSKCSFLDQEALHHHSKYQGRRISRGLFRARDGTLINADMNAAYNILSKAVPNAFADGIEGVGLHPKRVTLEEDWLSISNETI